jgi:hypothetical protein
LPHWLSKVVDLLQVETADLRELATLAGGNPKTFYRGARLNGVDLTGQDLSGMEFTDLHAANVALDGNTKLDSRYARTFSRANEEITRIGVEEYDTAWAEKWTKKFHAAHTVADRELVNEEGEALLALHSPVDDRWPTIWHQIWLKERKNSIRRHRLNRLALTHIARFRESSAWLPVFRRLWKHGPSDERDALSEFMQRSLREFAAKNGGEDKWFQDWSAFWTSSKTSGLGSELLFDVGLNWLQRQSINHRRWSSMWRSLWGISTASSRHVLREMGMHWLTASDQRALGWSSVWRRLWKDRDRQIDTDPTLLGVAEWWLENNPQSTAWGYVWEDIRKRLDDRAPPWLTSVALEWLRSNIQSKAWPAFWRKVLRHAQSSDREFLRDLGSAWLRERAVAEQWPVVFLEVWNIQPSRLEDDLRGLANDWLSKHPRSGWRNAIHDAVLTASADDAIL